MAVRIERSLLTCQMEEMIRNHLVIQAEEEKKKSSQFTGKGTVIIFFTGNKEYIDLPMVYGISLIGKPIVRGYPLCTFKFTQTLFPVQVPIVEEAWTILSEHRGVQINLPPGDGKTVVGAKLASRAGFLTLVFTHRHVISKQWFKTFTRFTDATIWWVGQKVPDQTIDVIITVIDSFEKIPQELADMVGTLIIDESHALCTPKCVKALLGVRPQYVISESATPEREDGLHKMIDMICGRKAIKKPPYKPLNVVRIMTGLKFNMTFNKVGPDHMQLANDMAVSEKRNTMILTLVRQNLHRKILIMTRLVEHAVLLSKTLTSLGVKSDYLCGRKSTYKDSQVLVGSISKVGTGFDEAAFCDDFGGILIDLLIMTCTVRKPSLQYQIVGRIRHSDPTIVVMTDINYIVESQWNAMAVWFTNNLGTISERVIVPPK